MVKVSVVIPTYKRNIFLKRAIDSVLAQTFRDFEIIIVDDNGEENKYRKNNRLLELNYKIYTNIHFIYPLKNLGGSGSRNIGIKYASGQYVAFLDDDDTFYPVKLERMISVADAAPPEQALFYNWTKSSRGTEYCNVYNGFGHTLLFSLFRDDCLAATSQLMIKKSVLDDISGFMESPAKQDSLLTFKILNAGYAIRCVPEILSRYNEHDGTRISGARNALLGEHKLYQCYQSSTGSFTKKQSNIIKCSFALRFFKYSFKEKKYMDAMIFLYKYILFRCLRNF
ncbi:glycosyltransferase family 2 protein [Lapidilactobacillus dextrinicus]|uniref:glycosyltransferase family 2 protein n=1 Tax=Lapidilactobacillus dextrinicus TaxID=51664 RepID=UPI003F27FDCB